MAVRFSIRNLLNATFWACAWGAVLLNFKHVAHTETGRELTVFILATSFVVAGPFIIVGSALGRGWRGFAIGTCVAVTLTVLLIAFANSMR